MVGISKDSQSIFWGFKAWQFAPQSGDHVGTVYFILFSLEKKLMGKDN